MRPLLKVSRWHLQTCQRLQPYVELGVWNTVEGHRAWRFYRTLNILPRDYAPFPHPLKRRSTLMGAWKKNRKRGCV